MKNWQIGLLAYAALVAGMALLWKINQASRPPAEATSHCGWGVADPIACPDGKKP